MRSVVCRFAGIVVGGIVIACLGLLPAAPAQAAGPVVTNCLDDGSATTLRVAIANATTGETITFTPGLNCTGASVITLTGGTLTLSQNVTIDGTGATIVVDGNNAVTVFAVNNGVTATLNALTIQHGNTADAGGGIANFDGTLTVTNSTVANNTAFNGGGIYNDVGGGTVTVTNSTITSNSASNVGGGIFNNINSHATVTNGTFSGNSGGRGGDIFYNASSTTTLTNTIVANATSGRNCATDGMFPGILNAGTDSLADDGSCGGATQATSAQIDLQPLASNGGPTQTMALGPGSVAIDQGVAIGQGPNDNPVLATDQRGKPRVHAPDIGAFELQGFTLTVNSMADGTANTTNCETGNAHTCRLRDAIAVANVGAAGANPTITFDATTFPANTAKTIMLDATAGTLVLTANVTINGSGHRVVMDGGCTTCNPGGTQSDGVGIFRVNSGVMATLNGLTIEHGSGTLVGANTRGGGIYNDQGTVTVTNSTLSGSGAATGGGIYNDHGTLMVTNSTFAGNAANSRGGGIANDSGTVTVTNATLSGNPTGSGNGNGIFTQNPGTVTLSNTIVAGGRGCSVIGSTLTADSHNLADDNTCGGATVTTGAQIALQPLANNGGPTETIALGPGSVAIDAGDDTICNATSGTAPVNKADQRGILRPQGAHCDIGAFEARFSLTVSGGNNQSAVATQPFALPLAVTFGGADAPATLGGATVTFTAPSTGATATLTGNPATTNVSGVASVTVTANTTLGGPYAVTAHTPGATDVAFSLTNIAPTITLSPTMLPAGLKGVAYPTTTLAATGGTASYTFTVTAGTLTPGLTLNANGTFSGTPTAVGSSTFTVTATDVNSFTGTQQYTVSVTAAPLVSIAVTPANGTLKVGQTQQYTAMGTYQDNSTADITAQVAWSSDASAVASVDTSGKGMGQAPGTAHITATQGGKSGQTSVTVSGGTSVGIAPGAAPASRPGSAGTTPGGSSPPAPNPAPTGR